VPVTPVPDTFGGLLRHLRRRARITQRELGRRVGYSEGHICRLEQNRRTPEPSVLTALFVPALGLDRDPPSARLLVELARRTRSPRDVAPRIPMPPTGLVDRPDALDAVHDLLRTEPVVVIRGLPGSGRTTLAAAYARRDAADRTVYWTTVMPGLTDTVESIVERLVHVIVGPTSGGDVQQAPLTLDQRLDAIATALADTPALVVIDDADAVTGNGPRAVIAALATVPGVRMIVTTRTRLDVTAAPYQLGGLTDAQASELIATLDPGLPADLARRLTERTGGNPTLLRLALGQTRRPGADRAAVVDGLGSDPQVGAYVLGAVDRLGPDAENLLCLLAVFREPVDVMDETLIETAGTDGYDPIDAIADLRQRLLIDDPRAALLPPLIRTHTYARMLRDIPRRRRLHRVAAQWLEHTGADVLETAWHYGRSGAATQAIEVLTGDIRTLIGRGDAIAAADLLLELRRRAGHREPERVSVLLGDLLIDTVRADEAEAAYREALIADAPAPVWATVARSLAGSLLHRGGAAEAVTLCRTATARLGRADAVIAARIAATEARALLHTSAHDEALNLGRHALELAVPLSSIAPDAAAEVAAEAHFVVAVVHRLRRDDDAATASFHAATDHARRAGMHHLANRCRFNLGALRMEQGDMAEALRIWTGISAHMRAQGDSYGLARVLHSLALLHHFRDDQDQALALYDQACALKFRLGDRQGLANSEQGRALTLRSIGRIDEALDALRRILTGPAAHTESWARANYLDSLGTTLIMSGDAEAAIPVLCEAVELASVTGGLYRQVTTQHLALARFATGDGGPVAELAAQPLPPRTSLLEAQFDARLIRAVAALSRHDRTAALAALDDLSAWMESTGFRLYRAAVTRLRVAASDPTASLEPAHMLW
jgi:transcriptional regulator with XRE-family HTH domain